MITYEVGNAVNVEGAQELIDRLKKEIQDIQESAANKAETERIQAENARISAETERVEAENNRKSTFETNETERQNEFETNEDKRENTFEMNESARHQHAEERLGQLEEEYAPKLTEVTAQLAQKANQDFTDVLGVFPRFFTPKTVKSYDGSVDINAETITSTEVYALYDSLMTKYPDNIKKTLLGKDQSSTKDIYKYVFNFGSPKETLILGANIHGAGVDGDPSSVTLGLYEFLKQVCDEWESNTPLALMKYRFQFVVMPISNPWGYDNKARYNSRNVDLNRNFDYMWDEFSGAKGSTPFSESESQIIRDVLLSYPDAIAYFDIHSMMNKKNVFKFITVVPDNGDILDTINDVSAYMEEKTGYWGQVSINSTNPSGYNYANNVLGIPSCNPEFVVYPTDITPHHGSQLMTWMVEYYGNIIYRHCLLKTKFKQEPKPKPRIPTPRGVALSYDGTTIKLTSNTPKRMNEFNVVYDTDGAFQKNFSRVQIPEGVTHVRINASVMFKCKTTPELTNVELELKVSINGTTHPLFPYIKNNVMMSTSQSLHTLVLSTPPIPVNAGDRFYYDIKQVSAAGNISLDTTFKDATWWGIEFITEQ